MTLTYAHITLAIFNITFPFLFMSFAFVNNSVAWFAANVRNIAIILRNAPFCHECYWHKGLLIPDGSAGNWTAFASGGYPAAPEVD